MGYFAYILRVHVNQYIQPNSISWLHSTFRQDVNTPINYSYANRDSF